MLSSLLIVMSLMAGQPGGRSTHDAPAPIISVYTMGRGSLMVEKFGHAALCVKYRAGINELNKVCSFPTALPPKAIAAAIRRLWIRVANWKSFKAKINTIDPAWVPAASCVWRHRMAARNPREATCYNYGTTNFKDPAGLIWGFLRGQSKFWVAPQFLTFLYRNYTAKDRAIYKQVLPLSPAKAWATARKLEHDVLEENKHYNYHHFYDNCTTRVRDIVNDAVDGKLKVNTDKRVDTSFRTFGAKGFAESPWLHAVSDFVFGRGGEVKPTLWQAMFLPRIMRDEIEKRVGVKPVLVYKRKGAAFPYDEGNMGRHYTLIFALLIGLPLIASTIWGKFGRASLWIATVPLTLIALVVWTLAAISTLHELRVNEALLVFWPSDAALPFLSEKRRTQYARIRVAGLALVALLLITGLFKQPLWMPMLVVLLGTGSLLKLRGITNVFGRTAKLQNVTDVTDEVSRYGRKE